MAKFTYEEKRITLLKFGGAPTKLADALKPILDADLAKGDTGVFTVVAITDGEPSHPELVSMIADQVNLLDGFLELDSTKKMFLAQE